MSITPPRSQVRHECRPDLCACLCWSFRLRGICASRYNQFASGHLSCSPAASLAHTSVIDVAAKRRAFCASGPCTGLSSACHTTAAGCRRILCNDRRSARTTCIAPDRYYTYVSGFGRFVDLASRRARTDPEVRQTLKHIATRSGHTLSIERRRTGENATSTTRLSASTRCIVCPTNRKMRTDAPPRSRQKLAMLYTSASGNCVRRTDHARPFSECDLSLQDWGPKQHGSLAGKTNARHRDRPVSGPWMSHETPQQYVQVGHYPL